MHVLYIHFDITALEYADIDFCQNWYFLTGNNFLRMLQDFFL